MDTGIRPGYYKKYKMVIKLMSPLRIGSGLQHENVNLLLEMPIINVRVVKNNGQVVLSRVDMRISPLIPASSIKGSLRRITEGIAKRLYNNKKCEKIDDIPKLLALLHHQPTDYELKRRREVVSERLVSWDPVHSSVVEGGSEIVSVACENGQKRIVITSKELYECLLKIFGERLVKDIFCRLSRGMGGPGDWEYEVFASRYCPICLLYGSPAQAGAIRITDALPKEDIVSLTTRYRVAINRRTGTAKEGLLFGEVLVEPGVEFYSETHLLIPVYSPDEIVENRLKELFDKSVGEAMKLWELTREYVEEFGIEIGAGKTRGLGKVKIKLT